MNVVTAAEMRELDRRAREEHRIAGRDLMERAGRAIAQALMEASAEALRVVVLCGGGNNGGDGFVAARYLQQAGWSPEVLLVGTMPEQGDAADALNAVPEEVPVRRWEELTNPSGYLESFTAAIDALLGTGFQPPLREPYAAAIQALNRSRLYVVSADIPSGLDADTGHSDGAVQAHRTVTIGLPKIGFLSHEGLVATGVVTVAPIQFPRELLASRELRHRTLTPFEASLMLPSRHPAGNKGTFGCVAIAAGSDPMPGAAVLCALGAMRSGAGLVRVRSSAGARVALAVHAPEALLPVPAEGDGPFLHAMNDRDWVDFLRRTTAIVCGPGIGVTRTTRDLLFQILERGSHPTVLDADALNILAEDEEVRELLRPGVVLTPHPGELSRLLGRPVTEVQENRWDAARDAAQKFACHVVLKGHGTLVATPEGRVTHVGTGNSALARGGSGDLLTGLIGGLLAQGLDPEQAALLGCWIHGLSADILTRDRSRRGVTVRDIADTIPHAFHELENSVPR